MSLKKIAATVVLAASITIPSMSLAQKITPSSPTCLWTYTFPYVAFDTGHQPPYSKTPAVEMLTGVLGDVGIIKVMSVEVAGAKVFSCLIANQTTREQQIEIKEIAIRYGRGTLVSSTQHIKDLFSYPISPVIVNPDTGRLTVGDGLVDDPRGGDIRPNSIRAYEKLIREVKAWKARCGHIPFTEGCW
jgi:hypothetical protein